MHVSRFKSSSKSCSFLTRVIDHSRFSFAFLFSLLLSTSFSLCYASDIDLPKIETDPVKGPARPDKEQTAEFEPKLQLFLPPVLEKGKPFWGSLYDLEGRQAAPHQVLINGRKYMSDDFACLKAQAPEADKVTIEVLSEASEKLWQTTYYATDEAGLLVSDKSAARLLDSLDALNTSISEEPIISHAPSLVQSLQTIVVIGRNFTGKQGDSELEIDGRESDILASSTRSLVAVTNRNLAPGAIKVLRVSCRNLSSLPVECDVARVDIKAPSENSGGKLRVQVIGSNLPALVTVSNSGSKDLSFGNWRLGKENVFLTPGGQKNTIFLDGALQGVSARLISNGLFDPYSLKSTKNLISSGTAAAEEASEFIRLKKREIALEMKKVNLEQEKKALEKEGKMSPNSEEDERLETSSLALSNRLYRIGKMLNCRRAVIEAYGGIEIKKLLDAASGNQNYLLDEAVASQDLGFTEARLIRVVARRHAAEKEKNLSSMQAYMPQYNAPPAAVLESYRKRYGRRGMVPPPPQTPVLIPPPAPFRPGPNDLGPFIPDLPESMKQSRAVKTSSHAKNLRKKAGRGPVFSKSASAKPAFGSPKKPAAARPATSSQAKPASTGQSKTTPAEAKTFKPADSGKQK